MCSACVVESLVKSAVVLALGTWPCSNGSANAKSLGFLQRREPSHFDLLRAPRPCAWGGGPFWSQTCCKQTGWRRILSASNGFAPGITSLGQNGWAIQKEVDLHGRVPSGALEGRRLQSGHKENKQFSAWIVVGVTANRRTEFQQKVLDI